MRVIAGTARRLLLKTPEGLDIRPTTDRIKETLFNILQTDIPGSVFFDLFSGSGGIGKKPTSWTIPPRPSPASSRILPPPDWRIRQWF